MITSLVGPDEMLQIVANVTLLSGPGMGQDASERVTMLCQLLHSVRYLEIQIRKGLQGDQFLVPRDLTSKDVTPTKEMLELAKVLSTVGLDVLPMTPQEQNAYLSRMMGPK